MKYKINIKNWKMAVLLSAVLSLFGVITNHTTKSDFNVAAILAVWFITFSFLLTAWTLNSKITSLFLFDYKKWNWISKIFITIFANAFLLTLFIGISTLVSQMFHFEREYNFIYSIIRGSVSVAIIYLVQYTLNLNAKSQSVLLQNQMLKTENIRAQFETLKQQISPHFLFNSLSSLRFMIRASNPNAEKFVMKLSDIYRLLLAHQERDTITLREELAFISDYSFLLFARYENRLHIKIDISDNLLDFGVPTFTLQLLLENCVKHNIVSKEKPLHIKIYDSGVQSISIENNLQQKIAVGEESGYGLRNLMKRYALLSVSDGVQIFSDESSFCVKIQLLDL
jgi:two-component system, LytTR family, sensor kinase